MSFTTASLAISAGANVTVVQRQGEHATTAVTLDRYGNLVGDDLAGVTDASSKAAEATAGMPAYAGGITDELVGQILLELQRPHSPIGRGSGLKIRTVWVRVPVGALERPVQELL
jgi:hypothetical protein